jgi:hypothetical protein
MEKLTAEQELRVKLMDFMFTRKANTFTELHEYEDYILNGYTGKDIYAAEKSSKEDAQK